MPWILLISLTLTSVPPPNVPATSVPPTPARRTLAAAAAIVPGVLVAGGGHWILGDTPGAKKIAALKGAGLATFVAGFLPILYSNASDKVMHASYPVVIGGFGLFSIATLADLYGVVFSGRPPGTGPTLVPSLELEQHWMHVEDDQFTYDDFWHVGLTGRLGGARLRGDFFHSPTDGNTRMGLEAAWRFLGPRPARDPGTTPDRGVDNSFLELSAGLIRHDFLPERFRVTTPQCLLLGRMDLERLHPSLRGSFAELGAGWGLEFTDYRDVAGPRDRAQLLLFQVAYGLYLGSGERAGEVRLFYDHRHDDWAGGAQGVLGFFGLRGRFYFSRHWGVDWLAERGTATRVMLGAVFRY
ncbi:MAG: hypothetical protein CVU59_02365 [Deltaproteobacteria bacterium HGW-Deltaproteobacteria-17]|nr:MAG: hypothetical protein CVU59_02365 [Deltaproteobacteria bacterium HGW-Deltaproteobacteria-17]